LWAKESLFRQNVLFCPLKGLDMIMSPQGLLTSSTFWLANIFKGEPVP